MSPRRSPLVPFVLAALAIGGAIAWLHKPIKAADDPLAACPADAFLVAKVDMTQLRATPLGEIADQVLRNLVPLPSVRAEASPCDTSKVDSLAIVVPEGDERSDIGLAMKLRMSTTELARCASSLSASSSSSSSRESSKQERQGAFTLFASGEPRADTLAASDNGLVLLGARAWALSMADAASGRAPGATKSPPHADVLRALGARTLLVSVALPKATRARIRKEMVGDRESSAADRTAMEGVLGVEAVGAAVDVLPKTAETELVAELRCDSVSSCAAVNDLVSRKKKAWTENPIVRLLGLGQAADALTISLQGSRLEIRTRLRTEDLRNALERVLAWRKFTPNRSPAPSPALPDAGPDGG